MRFGIFSLFKVIVFFFLSLISYRTIFSSVTSICPNKCSGHGHCNNGSLGSCSCYPTYTGYDCSLRVCPSGYAWVDMPTDEYTAHAKYTECSNMGICDRSTGICSCKYGFEGASCDIMKCPTGIIPYSIPAHTNITAICSGNGRCVSLHDVTRYQTFNSYLDYTMYSGWDEYKIHGCVCEHGWEGIACEKRSCPKGYDPLISSQLQVNEIQYIDCQCYSTDCRGGLYISFEGQQTPLIPYDAAAELIQFRFNQFTSIKNFKVQVEIVYGTKMCSSTGSVTKILFLRPQGPQSTITVLAGGGLKGHGSNAISVRSNGLYSLIDWSLFSRRGLVTNAECSNRGTCDYSTGTCTCFDGFRSSDGLGDIGNIGDCGYQYNAVNSYTTDSGTEITTSCPYNETSGICSSNGQCNEDTGTCTCHSGYGGPSCSLHTCESSFAWFGNVDKNHATKSECAGVGTCDTETGICSNCGGGWELFSGDKCETLACPVVNSEACSGNGTCLTIREIAELHYNEEKEWDPIYYTEPWDANLIRGCSCLRAISIDNQYSIEYANYAKNFLSYFSYNVTANSTILYTDSDITKFYRGPYSFAATDFKGYACQQAYCPKGDNPWTKGVNEIQILNCAGSNGTFFLSFRSNISYPIPWNVSLYEFKMYLEELFTIGEVIVSNSGPNYLCSSDYALCESYMEHGIVCNSHGTTDVYIEFLSEFGDLPLLKSENSLLQNKYHYSINITEYQKGTKEDLECSGQGGCNEKTGICSCYDGFGSSNGLSTTPGERGDCTFYNNFYTSSHKFFKR